MKKHYLLFIILLFCQVVSAQEMDAYDLGVTPNSYLSTKNKVDYCIKNKQFNIRHLLIQDDADFDLFLKHADKFKHIDSLSIGREGSFCKLVYELENRILEKMPNLPDLPNLEFLSVMIISMKFPAENIGDFKKLKFLELVGDFEQIPESVWGLEQLETLHLSAYFTEVSPKVYQLPNLKVLTLEGEYKDLPQSPQINSKWQYLRLKGLLPTIPSVIEKCPNLRYFQTISDVPFRISNNISKASNLEEIRFENTIITHISEEIQHLDKVKAIYLNNSWLKSIPAGIFKMDALEDLRLDFSWTEEMIQDIMGAKYWPYPALEFPENIPFNPNIEYIDLMDRPISKSSLKQLLDVYTEEVVSL